MDYPLIYGNGCSFSAEDYDPSLTGKTYVNFVAQYCHGFAMNKAMNGSSNRRIVRTTVHDMIHQRQLNPDQQIIALIQLTTDVRSEIWVDSKKIDLPPEESNLRSIQFASRPDWKENLLQGLGIESLTFPYNEHGFSKKYWDKLVEGLAYFHSGYAEYINLLCDLIMLQTLLDSLKIDFVFFSGPQRQKFESDYLLDFFKNKICQDPRYIDIESFGFCSWSASQNFIPIDSEANPYMGHYGPEAHQAFAEQILVPKLKELSML